MITILVGSVLVTIPANAAGLVKNFGLGILLWGTGAIVTGGLIAFAADTVVIHPSSEIEGLRQSLTDLLDASPDIIRRFGELVDQYNEARRLGNEPYTLELRERVNSVSEELVINNFLARNLVQSVYAIDPNGLLDEEGQNLLQRVHLNFRSLEFLYDSVDGD